MPFLYGSPLPPGVEAPTQGELRIRVDKLLIDDASVNRSPLVSFHFGAPGVSVDPLSGSQTISPNRFIIPVDYCTVSPLFWGEEKPSVSCQPSTAQHHRGPFTLVFPVKVDEDAFQMYLKNMSASSHQGLQFEVHVPSSYSGRPPVLIGKCNVHLDSLASPMSSSFSKNIIHGWFSVLHLSHPQVAGTMEGDAMATSPASPPLTVPIGKLKLHVHLHYFSKPDRRISKRQSKIDGLSHRSALKRREEEEEEEAEVVVEVEEGEANHKESRRARHSLQDLPPDPFPSSVQDHAISVAGLNTSAEASSHGEEASDQPSVEVERVISIPVNAREGPRPTIGRSSQKTLEASEESSSNSLSHARKAAQLEALSGNPMSPSTSTTTTALLMRELLRKGAALRSRMEVAATEPPSFFSSNAGKSSLPRSSGFPFLPQNDPPSRVNFSDKATEVWGGGYKLPDAPSVLNRECKGATEAGIDDISSVLYTSEESDAEEFMIELQREQATARKGCGEISPPVLSQPPSAASHPKEVEETALAPCVASTALGKDFQGTLAPVSGIRGRMPRESHALNAHKTVAEMCFTDVSFASTDMTKDLEEIRINVRLSKDITVESPASGPFSSFVHRIPLAQPTICLSFVVCFYNEKTSRLVIEFIKVKSRARQIESAVEREVLSEELLGLCIVSMFNQSRDIVLRDPVSSQTNAYCHLDLQLFPQGGDRVNPEITAHTTAPVNHIRSEPSRRPKALLITDHHHSNGPAGSSSYGEANVKKKNRTKRGASYVIQKNSPHSTEEEEEAREGGREDANNNTGPSFIHHNQATSEETRWFNDHKLSLQTGSHNIEARSRSSSHVLLCLCIHDIQGLPRVVLNSEEGYTAPNPFVVLDALMRADGSLIEDWCLEAKGSFDRTEVVYNTQRPFFGYRSVLRIPLRRNPLKGNLTNGPSEGKEEVPSTSPIQTRQRVLLGDLSLTLWHYARKEEPRRGAAESAEDSSRKIHGGGVGKGGHGELHLENSSHKLNKGDGSSEEVQFWSCAALMGTCCVDLRPLKYLNQLEGYYRVLHEIEGKSELNSVGLAGNKPTTRFHVIGESEDEAGTDKGGVVGYIHISVSLL